MKYVIINISLIIVIIVYLIKIFNRKDNINNKNIYKLIIFYIIFLFLTLFYRSRYDNYLFSDGTYIKSWLKILFTNRIVFINMIGNILIFIPLGVIFCCYTKKFLKSILMIIGIIIIIESLQYITKRGVFDILDIVLNTVGATLGYVIYNKYTHRRRGEKDE